MVPRVAAAMGEVTGRDLSEDNHGDCPYLYEVDPKINVSGSVHMNRRNSTNINSLKNQYDIIVVKQFCIPPSSRTHDAKSQGPLKPGWFDCGSGRYHWREPRQTYYRGLMFGAAYRHQYADKFRALFKFGLQRNLQCEGPVF